ncbi:MAG: hypothetical protein JXR63_10440 [Spirochaetales bacterium]|nr:hypothetical protein [Spirochaetales bacterium]
MKKINYIVIFTVFAMAFSGCTKEEDKQKPAAKDDKVAEKFIDAMKAVEATDSIKSIKSNSSETKAKSTKFVITKSLDFSEINDYYLTNDVEKIADLEANLTGDMFYDEVIKGRRIILDSYSPSWQISKADEAYLQIKNSRSIADFISPIVLSSLIYTGGGFEYFETQDVLRKKITITDDSEISQLYTTDVGFYFYITNMIFAEPGKDKNLSAIFSFKKVKNSIFPQLNDSFVLCNILFQTAENSDLLPRFIDENNSFFSAPMGNDISFLYGSSATVTYSDMSEY